MSEKFYTTDLPVVNKDEDKFQRYEFAKRIADTILNRKNRDGYIISIYGAWGEGKTSVLNFIEKELKSKTDCIFMKFNPWRYEGEDALLLNFFNQPSSVKCSDVSAKFTTSPHLYSSAGHFCKV